jgi:8-oxo-dGTP diphosphatase
MSDSSSARSSAGDAVTPAGLRNWKVAGGVVRRGPHDVLLVENERKDRSIDWSTPGGVVDAGETFVQALRREVREETGLDVLRWRGPLYRVEVTAPDLGFFLEVEAHGALDVTGEVTSEINDPDGIVLSAAFLSIEHATRRLDGAARFVREPLLAHLVDGVDDGRTFAYRILGRGGDRVVERVDG